MLFFIYGNCCVVWLSSSKRVEENKMQHPKDIKEGVSPDTEMKTQMFLYDYLPRCGLGNTAVEGDWTTQHKLISWKVWRCNVLHFLTTSSHRQLHLEEHIWCWSWFKLWDNHCMPCHFFLHSNLDVEFKTIWFWTYNYQHQFSRSVFTCQSLEVSI